MTIFPLEICNSCQGMKSDSYTTAVHKKTRPFLNRYHGRTERKHVIETSLHCVTVS